MPAEKEPIGVIGVGWVGLVTGACFAELGHQVYCRDILQEKIDALNGGSVPIWEPNLTELVERNRERLHFTTDMGEVLSNARLLFCCVDTPPTYSGDADLSRVERVIEELEGSTDHAIVMKSTVPVGTGRTIQRNAPNLGYVSNPEFLKEGAAVEDFMRPDRIVIGAEDPDAISTMRELYAPFQRNHERLQVMDIRSAELTKYAANAMLATRISFMNELALMAERLGADIEHVRVGIGSDPRIGYHFLYPGAGYGGSCFPKDVTALLRTAQECGLDLKVVRAVEEANERQKGVLVEKVVRRFGEKLEGRRFALWASRSSPTPTTCARLPAACCSPRSSSAARRWSRTIPSPWRRPATSTRASRSSRSRRTPWRR